MVKRKEFFCKANGYFTKEGKMVIDRYISDIVKNHKLVSIVKEILEEKEMIKFTVSYR